jgi:hypothetical protein
MMSVRGFCSGTKERSASAEPPFPDGGYPSCINVLEDAARVPRRRTAFFCPEARPLAEYLPKLMWTDDCARSIESCRSQGQVTRARRSRDLSPSLEVQPTTAEVSLVTTSWGYFPLADPGTEVWLSTLPEPARNIRAPSAYAAGLARTSREAAPRDLTRSRATQMRLANRTSSTAP